MKLMLKPWAARFVAAGAIGLAVWALRLALVGDLGTGIPYADQWEGEALTIYEPWLAGHLSWHAIFAPYLEHRIVWTHLWNLGLLEMCGQWDPMVQMVAQAVIPSGTAALCVWGLLPARAERYWRSLVLLGALLAFGSPLAYENILWGFQSQFAFLVALSLGLCAFTALASRNGRYWWLVLLVGLAMPLAMGAGALGGPIVVAMTILVLSAERQISPSSKGMLVVGIICCLWGLLMRSDSPRTSYAYAKSVSQFMKVWLSACAWPNSRTPTLAILTCLPAVILLIQVLRKKIRPKSHELFILGTVIWAVASAAGGARARGALGSSPPSRYVDFLALLCGTNSLALATVVRTWWIQGGIFSRTFGVMLVVAWTGSTVYGGTQLLERFLKIERATLQAAASRRFDMVNAILDGGVAVAVIVDRKEKMPLPHEVVMESRVLAPFLPAELQKPFGGMTPQGLLTISPAIANTPWRVQSGEFEARAAAMVVFINGNSTQLNLSVLNQRGETSGRFEPSGRRIGNWAEWLMRSAPGRYRLSIVSAPVSGDLGIMLPRPLSAPGYWARRVSAERAILVGLAVLGLGLALCVSCNTVRAVA